MLSIFKNDNEWNEKTIIGALAFLVMVIFAIIDLITGILSLLGSIFLLSIFFSPYPRIFEFHLPQS